MKGFISIIVVLAIIVTAIILVGTNNNLEKNDYYEQFAEKNLLKTNYFVVLTQAAQDCNWDLLDSEIVACIKTKSDNLLVNLKQSLTECTADIIVFDNSLDFATERLRCNTVVKNDNGNLFYLSFTKDLNIGKQ